ncbi:MAG: type II toxin-antitoxin system VapC family toxin [Verrucomicrobia bacterium]|jgi:PIN domain nuclease of toxin-antitoxin system|nr:type II toxin-antitoxin system VapC family toxin [Verrucomicrobiota bacterium]MDA7510088.1 type II toxin-antitoxin system VapC family toxin [Verrucomicrobiota bacterium]MDA7644922.1 type II toxin-antitoxin system VapC family toxin [bacterium]MDA7667662.1 type II toxin-antitoxin system VapC family toxin [bacterium]
MANRKPLILDTCALLFLATGDRRLSAGARKALSTSTVVSICSITGFEIALKVAQGKLELPLSPREWLAGMVDEYDLNVIDLDLEICQQAAELPSIHRDPCDRFIIAAAMRINAGVVTADPVFARYGVDVLG